MCSERNSRGGNNETTKRCADARAANVQTVVACHAIQTAEWTAFRGAQSA